jgi:hypothetical protein
MGKLKAPKISKSRQKRRGQIAGRKKRDWISDKIRTIMKEYKKTGMVGRSTPINKRMAQKQAIAIAYSMAHRENFAASEIEIQNDSIKDTVSGFRLMGGMIIAIFLIDYALKTEIFKEGLKWDN